MKTLCTYKIIRNLTYLSVLEGCWKLGPQEETKPATDRIWMGFDSGDQELFEYDGSNFMLLETEKSKEHEAPLTGIDYNRKLGLVVSSCKEGMIRIWTLNKKFMREIFFPHGIDSVCFHNNEGDILVSHEKRISLIQYQRYKIAAFDYVLSH